MKPFLLSLVVICLSVPVFLAAGSAQGIDPQCTGMRDKVGCTCAVQTAEMLLPIARTDMGNGLGAIQDAAFKDTSSACIAMDASRLSLRQVA